MKKISIFAATALLSLAMCMAVLADTPKFNKTKAYESSFTDVKETDWFYKNVSDVFELGLMEGVAADKFDTESSLNAAQGITLASRLHAIYNEKEIPEVEGFTNWYDKYVHYAVDNAILDALEFTNYTQELKSYRFVSLLANALPDEFYAAKNTVTEIPDVTESMPYYNDVLKFYNAGILKGNDAIGTFYPESTLTRKRAAAIIARVALPEARESFTLEKPKSTYTISELEEIVNTITEPEIIDTFAMLTVGDVSYSIAEYKYFYTSLSENYKGDELEEMILSNFKRRSAVVETSIKNNLPLTYDALRAFYTDYYTLKYQYRDIFPVILGIYGTTDAALCRDQLYYQLYPVQYYELFGENKPNGFTKEQVVKYAKDNDYICAKHILISNETENALDAAKEVYAKVQAGQSFDELIKQYGQDPGALYNPNGYYFTKGVMAEPFEKAAYALEVGKYSEIVESNFGYHIILRCEFDENDFAQSSEFASIANTIASQNAAKYYQAVEESLKVEKAAAFDEFKKLLD